jgi:RNA polymerase sigma-70 factor (ECF subfamily)
MWRVPAQLPHRRYRRRKWRGLRVGDDICSVDRQARGHVRRRGRDVQFIRLKGEARMSHDELDFQSIHETFRPKIHRYLSRLVGEDDAEDLTQEVFVKVSRALSTFRGESQLSTWIYRIATNAAIDKMRAPSFQQDSQNDSVDDMDEIRDEETWSEGTPTPEQQLVRKDMYECFGNFMQNLPANYRTVVALSELGELTNQEIAEILGLSLDTVKIRLHRGRARLFKELKAYCKAEDWL